jgi:hypothetical protein
MTQYLLRFLILCIFANKLCSQENKNDNISNNKANILKYSGNVNIISEYTYNNQKNTLDSLRNVKQDRFSYKALLNFNFNILNQVDIPIELWLTSQGYGYRQNFNQFGVNPKINDWLVLHGGCFSSRISDYTFGDTRVLGGGFDLTPGNFRLSFLYGRIKEGRDKDSSAYFLGDYKRYAYALKIGYGTLDDIYCNINLLKAWDNSSKSVQVDNSIHPTENMVLSLDWGFPISKIIKFNAETALSAYSNDIGAQEYKSNDIPSFASDIFTPRYSTQLDGAAKMSLSVIPSKYYSFKLNASWVGPGFKTLGYEQLYSDVLDLTFAPGLRLFNGDIDCRASIGIRKNNLRNNHLAATQRMIYSFDMNTRINSNLNLYLQYANYGMKTRARRDTITYENISQNFTVNPSYTFKAFDANNLINASFTYQNSDDKSSYSLYNQYKNTSSSSNLSYSLIFNSGLSFISSIYYNSSKSTINSKVIGCSETAAYDFFEKMLSSSITIGYNNIKYQRSDSQFSLRLNLGYSFKDFGNLSLCLSNISYSSDAAGNADYYLPSYKETYASLQYALSF